jgi:SAM-dependent methyltransferase
VSRESSGRPSAAHERTAAGANGGGRSCPVCGSSDVADAFAKHDWMVRHCRACGLRYRAEPLDPHALPLLYGEDYFTTGGAGYGDYVGEGETHLRQARRYLRLARRLGAGGRRVYDIGCAAGFFLAEARRAGWAAHGCDVSDYAARHAREVLGLDVEAVPFLEAAERPGGYDLVTVFNAFEHLPDPVAAVEKLGRLVRPGGYLLIETWDADSMVARAFGPRWHQYDPRYVPFYYTRRSLGHLFTPREWRLAHFGRWAKWISVGRAAEIVAQNTPGALGRGIGRLSRGLLARLEVPYALGDLVMVAFQRRDAAPGGAAPLAP